MLKDKYMKKQITEILNNEKGSVLIMSILALVALLGFAALAIDITHLTVVKNELQNAADAGALAGAAILFNEDGDTINAGADDEAETVAASNMSDQELIDATEVVATRGHWSFTDRAFTANDSTEQVSWITRSLYGGENPLDTDTNYINAVRVSVSRSDVVSFFAGVLGLSQFSSSADAIAYRGFSGPIEPGAVDQPIAICAEAILNDSDEYSCNIGRLINSGSNELNNETGGWTSFEQAADPVDCIASGTNAADMSGLICSGGNPNYISAGRVAANGGEIQSAFNALVDCWREKADTDGDGTPDQPWNMNLLVVRCPGNNMENCPEIVGMVNINLIWINVSTDPQFKDVPTTMANWSCTPAEDTQEARQACWESFVEHFNLQNVDGLSAPYQQKAIYFTPDCTQHEFLGGTGDNNFGIQAKYPVLVE